MRIDQFESGDRKEDGDRPWRKHAAPLNKPPTNPDYPKQPFNHDEWMKSSKPVEEDSSEMPEIGDTIRTNKMQMDGKVEKIGMNRAGYEEVIFRIADGRLMKTPMDNVTVVQKLADGDSEVMEDQLDEVSNELLAKYKTAAGKSASAADKQGDYKTGDKRFSGIVKATKKQFNNDAKKKEVEEGGMGGINRSAPSNDVSYEKVLDEVYGKWSKEQQINELSVDKMKAYTQAANMNSNIQQRPLRKVVKTVRGVRQANDKIDTRTGKGRAVAPNSGTNEDSSPQEIASKIKIRSTDVPALYALMNGEIKFNDLPQAVRMALYKEYSGMPYDQAQNTTPGMINAVKKLVAEQEMTDEAIDPWHGYTKDDPKANAQAKAPKNAKQGTADIPFSELVQDTIRAHGVKWAFEYYVKKHGLPPRQFQIFAGLTADKPGKKLQGPAAPAPKGMEPEKQSWWKKLRGKLPFEE